MDRLENLIGLSVEFFFSFAYCNIFELTETYIKIISWSG